jgi:ankyrin repeat protein
LQDGRTALHLAASEGHGDVVEALLKAACNKDMQTKAEH